MKTILRGILIILAFFVVNNTFAQVKAGPGPQPVSATISAKGTVLAPISVVSTRDLDFGSDLLPGVPRVIAKTSNSSGKFSIMGQNGKEVSIVMSLPGNLTNGENVLALYFNPDDAGYIVPGGTMTDFDPISPVNAVFGTDNTMDIYLGGTVSPTYTQPGGLYEGLVTVEFYYTGN
jgi:hypothetical protein